MNQEVFVTIATAKVTAAPTHLVSSWLEDRNALPDLFALVTQAHGQITSFAAWNALSNSWVHHLRVALFSAKRGAIRDANSVSGTEFLAI
jgi:hypothetical protein